MVPKNAMACCNYGVQIHVRLLEPPLVDRSHGVGKLRHELKLQGIGKILNGTRKDYVKMDAWRPREWPMDTLRKIPQ